MQVLIQNMVSDMETRNVEAIFKRFGDEQSNLLDRYERLSFEVQLNQAILGRSLSEATASRRTPPPSKGRSSRRGSSGFQKVVKKLLSPILGKKDHQVQVKKDSTGSSDTAKNNSLFLKTFSKSMRV